MHAEIVVESPVVESPRVQQIRGLFDLEAAATSRCAWVVDLPVEDRRWHVGLMVGPSGCGKSTIARRLWPGPLQASTSLAWPKDQAVLDAFPAASSVKDVVALLSAVGFSAPPAWLRPWHVLSTGQQFRVMLARLLAEAMIGGKNSPEPDKGRDGHDGWVAHDPGSPPVIVCDEFTSVVDRTVAQVGSHALAKTVRQHQLQFVAVTCHEDVEAWLNPDWTYRPAENLFAWRCLRRRPPIALTVLRCQASAWPLFAPHHYLSNDLLPSATCFLATWQDRPCVFSAWLPFVGSGPPARREHRTVTLPDYQGAGLGNAVSDTIASMWKALGFRATSTTTHPAMIRSRCASANWHMTRAPAFAAAHEGKLKHATTRLTASFRYIGPRMQPQLARMLHAV